VDRPASHENVHESPVHSPWRDSGIPPETSSETRVYNSHPPMEDNHHAMEDFEGTVLNCSTGVKRDQDAENVTYKLEQPPPLPLNTMDSILSVAITAEYNACARLGSSPISQSSQLNKAEQDKLNELLMASQALHTPVDEEAPQIPVCYCMFTYVLKSHPCVCRHLLI